MGTNWCTGHEHETAFKNLVTDTRPLILPDELAWLDQRALFDRSLSCEQDYCALPIPCVASAVKGDDWVYNFESPFIEFGQQRNLGA